MSFWNCAVREATLLTPQSVAERTSWLDWDTQPSSYKHYPLFCYRLKLSDFPSLEWLEEARRITDERLVSHKPYRRLNVPSAGNLHPLEIYVQLRDIPGVLSGLYHLDVPNRELVMISEIAGEGIEPFLGLEKRFYGTLVMISIVPFRSSWKYGRRAWRYLYLDLGHQIGALSASVKHFGLGLTKMSPRDGLNRIMGMGDEEFVAAAYGIGTVSGRPVKALQSPLMRVQPSDYCRPDEVLGARIRRASIYSEIPAGNAWADFRAINAARRSARGFNPDSISDETMQRVMGVASPPSLEIVTLLFRARTMHPGVYRNGRCVERGDFIAECVRLLLDQRFISGAGMVVLIYAEKFCEETHIEAGVYAQDIANTCGLCHAGCSGIGAFYDDMGSRWSLNPLLYAVAIGGKTDG